MQKSEKVVLWAGVVVLVLIGLYFLVLSFAVRGVTPRPDAPIIDRSNGR